MRGIIRFCISLVILLAATGCGSETTPSTEKKPVSAATIPGDLSYQDVLQKGAVIHNLAMTPEGKVWVGTHAGLFSSADNQLWLEVSTKLADVDVTGWYIDPEKSGDIYIGGSNALKASHDHGKTWTDLVQGLPENPDVRGLVGVRDASGLTLYAAISGDGVYRFGPSGQWEKWLPLDQEVYSIAYLAKENRIYVATQYGLLFAATDEKVWQTEPLGTIEQIYSMTVDERDGIIILATEQGIMQKTGDAWEPLAVKTPERLVVINQGSGDTQLVGVGESAYVYILRKDTWTKME